MSGDFDLFRYDAPPGTGGTLSVSTTGKAAGAAVVIYESGAPVALPDSAAEASGLGSASYPVTGGFTYYVVVAEIGEGTGSYTVTASHSGCGTCNPNGSYDNPRPLPSPSGGMIVNRLDHSALEPGFDTWEDCRDGLSCDWYSMTLGENERMTVTTYDFFDHLCDVEVSVFAPSEMEYWRSAGIMAPMTWDLFGTMEENGSQLTFVAPRAGEYRIRVRGIDPSTLNCPRYRMTVARGTVDLYGPPPVH